MVAGVGYLARFGSGEPTDPDRSGASPLVPELLCKLQDATADSGVVVHDTLFYSSAGGDRLYAIPDLSLRRTPAAPDAIGACSASDDSAPDVGSEVEFPHAYDTSLWAGSLNDMSAFDSTTGSTYLVSLGQQGELVITGPVMDPEHNLLREATYWVMPATLPVGGSFNPQAVEFGMRGIAL